MMTMRVTEEALKGDIAHFPLEIVQTMCEHQLKQGYKFDPSVFARDCTAGPSSGGFSWEVSPEGYGFWKKVIGEEIFDYYFYVKKDLFIEPLSLSKTKAGFQGELKNFPWAVVKAMVKQQVKQGNPINVKVFETDRQATADLGGFTWEDTEQGHEFWCDVIYDGKFHVFFEKYPDLKQ